MDEDFFNQNETYIQNLDQTQNLNTTIATQYWSGSKWMFQDQSSIIWANDTSDGNHTMVIDGAGDHYGPIWVTPWKISDLVNNELLSFHIMVKLPSEPLDSASTIKLYFLNDDNGKVHYISPAHESTGVLKTLSFASNRTVDEYVNTTVLDLMVFRAEYGDDRLVIIYDNMVEDSLTSGDILEFDLSYYEPDTPSIPTNKVLNYGTGILGGVLILIGVGSTSLWNPLQPQNPGIIDNGWKKIKSFFGRKKK